MKLILDNIHKAFDTNKVLKGASGTFEAGKIYALLGRNGSGKTTLFDLIANKKSLDQGEILLEENNERRALEQNDLFYMVANPLLPNFLTGREFLQFFIDVNKDRVKDDRSIEELLTWIDFDRKEWDNLIQTYSLGTRNKLQMLMFILLRPKVILMDEPLTSLDVVVQLQIKKLLKEIEKDHIILFSTHILQLATDICDDLVILSGGKLYPLPDEKLNDPDFEEEIIRILSIDLDETDEDELEDLVVENIDLKSEEKVGSDDEIL